MPSKARQKESSTGPRNVQFWALKTCGQGGLGIKEFEL